MNNNGMNNEVNNNEEGKSLHPGENITSENAGNMAESEAETDEHRLVTENTPPEELKEELNDNDEDDEHYDDEEDEEDNE